MTACNSYAVSWTVTGDTTAVDHFLLSFSSDGVDSFTNIPDARATSTQRSYSWTIPHGTTTSRGRIQVTAFNSANQEITHAFNPGDFTIRLPAGKPTAVPETLNSSLPAGTPAQFYARNSRPSSSCSDITDYHWEFPDGVVKFERDPSFTFSAPANGSATYYISLKVSDANGEWDQKSIPIYVSGFSSGTATPSSFSTDPVNLATGNYVYEHTDLRIPGKGFPFEFKRFYNSKFFDQTGQPLGFGWTHSYNLRLTTSATNAIVTFADGHSETHILDGGEYHAEKGVHDILTNIPDGSFMLTSKDQTRRQFDSQGRLVAVVDKNTNTALLSYDGNALTNITDTAGRQIAFESYGNGLLKQITDPLQRSIQFQYDSQSSLVVVIDANGGTNRFEYDANHQMTAAFDARGTRFVQNAYDELQRIVAYQTDAYTNQTGFFYDFVNRVTWVTNAFGKVSIHRHNERLFVTNIVDEAGNQESFAYNDNHNRILIRDKNGNETRYGYDGRGNVTNKVDALGNVTTIEYNAVNNPVRRVDALTNETTFGYDDLGNLTSTTNALKLISLVEYDDAGLPIVLTDARGFSTSNRYDLRGYLIAVIDAKGFTNRFEYDDVGRKVRHIDPLDRTNVIVYDNNDNILYTVNALGFTNAFTYNGNNNRISARDARGAVTTSVFDLKDRLLAVTDAVNNTVSNRYDALDRKVESIDARANSTRYAYDDVGNLTVVTNALNQVSRFTYDANGNQLTAANPANHTNRSYYDKLNRRILTVDPLSHTNATAYDALGRVTATMNANDQVTLFFHDAIGRLTNVVDSAGKSAFFGYDENGNRVRTTDPNGHTWTNAFDELNRLVEQANPDGTKTIFTYDPVGNLTNKLTPNGDGIGYSYDALNRLTNIAYPTGPPVTFAYDAVGNRTNMTDSLGITVWGYDDLNRLLSVTDPFERTVTNNYDEKGNRTSLTYPGDKTVFYSYDPLNRITGLTTWLGGIVSYTYDLSGNLVGQTNANQTTTVYGYDDASRLLSLTNARPDTSIISAYTLGLDPIGNHLQATNEQPLFPILLNLTNSYSYNSDNRLISLDGGSVSSDANGNITNIGPGTLAYDFENRLITFAFSNATGTCAYDGLGDRLARTVNGEARRFVLDRMATLTEVLVETDTNGSAVAFYIYGLGLAQRITPDGETATYHFDIRGSTVAITDSAGNVTDAYAFDSFGVLANAEGDSSQPFRYLGRHGILGDSTGLYHARARYFSPQLGRFLTKDPVTGKDSDGQSLNRYVYALNNPLFLLDKSGLCAQQNETWWFEFGDAQVGYWSAIIADPAKAVFNFVFHPFQTAQAISYTAQHPVDVFGKAFATLKADLSSGDVQRQSHAIGTFVSLLIPAASELKVGTTVTTVDQYALKAIEEGWFPVMKRGFTEPQGNIWLNVGDVWKYGTTKNPLTRYPQSFLNETGMGLRYERQFAGTLEEVLTAERNKILDYLQQAGVLPPGNKIIR
jgi:RHS repeat-associated protein